MPSWVAPFGVGFALSFSLILAIGAQNAFVLRQGLMRQHIGVLVLFCALSDAVLIIAGVAGLAPLLAQWLVSVERWLFAGAAGWLAIYGLMRGYAAWRGAAAIEMGAGKDNGLAATLAMAAVLTFGNPHVYLDTVILIGSVGARQELPLLFAVGASFASFLWFSTLVLGAKKLRTHLSSPQQWRIFDSVIGVVMLLVAGSLVNHQFG